MKKIEEMKAKLETLKKDAQSFLDEGKIEEANAKMEEAKKMKQAIDIQSQLDEDEKNELEAKDKTAKKENKTKENANIIRAMIKKVKGATLTEAENALLLPTTKNTEGENGESYILPQDIRKLINKKIRQYKSFRDVLGYMPTSALSGSFPVENFETVSELVDFTDGTDGTDSEDIKFTNVKFDLKEKAAFIKLSNTLLSLTDNTLVDYVAEVFAKKAVVTENKMAKEALETGKTVKTLTDWKALRSSINKDLDPAMLYDTVIVTNQTGFDYLDSAEDEAGRPILQPNPGDATKKMFKGHEIIVFSDALLPSTKATSAKAEQTPIIYGNLKEGAKFVDLDGKVNFKASEAAGFMSNTTIARLIEFVDVVQVDSSDKCYICGMLETAPKTGA